MSEILFPVGRMVGGSMYKSIARTDRKTKLPVLGIDGKPVVSYSFGLAIAKGREQHWSQTPWGVVIKQIGDLANPGISSRPDYAWKIVDGDSSIPNTKNKKPCDQDGYKGNWVLWFSQSWAPKLVNSNGTIDLLEPDSVVPGYFIEVYGSVKANGSTDSPGVYLNPICVALSGYGERIETSGIDAAAVGFGGNTTPIVGMSKAPVAGLTPPAVHMTPVAGLTPPAAPNPAFLAPPSQQRIMSQTAGGTYEQFIAAGWNDQQLIAAGHMRMG